MPTASERVIGQTVGYYRIVSKLGEGRMGAMYRVALKFLPERVAGDAAGLGQPETAIANGRKSVEMYPMSKDRYGGPWRLIEMALIYALAGHVDEAIDQQTHPDDVNDGCCAALPSRNHLDTDATLWYTVSCKPHRT